MPFYLPLMSRSNFFFRIMWPYFYDRISLWIDMNQPNLQPYKEEKLIAQLKVQCGPIQKERWQKAFGKKKVSGVVRRLLDAEMVKAGR